MSTVVDLDDYRRRRRAAQFGPPLSGAQFLALWLSLVAASLAFWGMAIWAAHDLILALI